MSESQSPDEERLRSVFADPSIDEISAGDLCGDYPAVHYLPPDGFGFREE